MVVAKAHLRVRRIESRPRTPAKRPTAQKIALGLPRSGEDAQRLSSLSCGGRCIGVIERALAERWTSES